MSEKRKDSKGRVLKDGESQRANGTYDYRYTDIHKKRRCIYAKSLTELRKKEDELRRDMADGIDYAAGDMTVAELVDRYMNLKRGLKQNSLRSYGSAVKRMHADPFGQKPIKTVKLSEAKGWFVFLHDSGIKQNTIGVLQSVVRPAFEMAVDDDIIRKNPFKFKLSDVVPKGAYVRDALTKEQQEKYLQFVQDCGGNYYDDIVILLGTGLRVSELYGLTRQILTSTGAASMCGGSCAGRRKSPILSHRPKPKAASGTFHDGRGLHGTDAGGESQNISEGGAAGGRSQRIPLSGQVRDAEGCDALGELYARSASEI